MKNLKPSYLLAVVFIALLCLVSCKVDNRIEDGYYSDRDFSVSCLYGFKYITRVSGGSYIAPKFDVDTGLPERCEK